MNATLARLAPASFVSIVALAAGCGNTSGTASDAGSDGAGSPIGFQPSNLSLSDIEASQAAAKAENVKAPCKVSTDAATPITDCFTSPIKSVKQPDGSTVNVVVVKSLTVEAGGAITVQGGVPFVLVSLADLVLSGTIDAHSSVLDQGAGGAPGATGVTKGGGAGGGAAGSASAAIGGSGGTYCGVGGQGGGQTTTASSVGNLDLRPLVGGSAGGGGAEGSGAGGGGIQLVANGAITINAGSSISVGGEGGPFSGVASNQNAGGGGSGGSILLEATSITIAGALAANGGGGGGDYAAGAGADATPNATPAAGAKGGTSGGAGGAGGAGAVPAGSPGLPAAGLNSGGGGGGTGRIRMNSASGSATVTGTVSPAQSTLCVLVAKVRAFSDGP